VVAVPEKVITPVLGLKLAEIPGGNPFAPGTPLFAIAVTPVVDLVNEVKVGLLIQTLGNATDGGPTVAYACTVVVDVAVVEATQPVVGSVYRTVTVFEPVVNHWIVAVELPVPDPPAVML
jgi:hypothetical protein